MKQPTRPIEAIKIGERHRKDFGDLTSLARAIDAEGLLQPIAITPDNVLIGGERRLRAWEFTRFRNQEIPVHVVDLDEIVRGEWSENANRKDFTPSEIVAIKRALAPKLQAEAKERQALAGPENGRGVKTTGLGNFPEPVKGRAADKLGAFVGKDRKTIEKMEAVVAAAEAEPEKYAELVEKMDKSGKVSGPYKRLQVMKQSEAIRREEPAIPSRGPYRVIVVDPPWPSEPNKPVPEGRAYFPYPTMSIDQICAVPVASVAAEDCVLWLWVTNFHMRYAFRVLDAWGFGEKSIVTWVKDKMGHGQNLRGKTEHCILATRGNPIIDLRAQTTVLEGRVRHHSQKPLKFYQLVESLCPASRYAEFFARGPVRSGWDGHGDQAQPGGATPAEAAE